MEKPSAFPQPANIVSHSSADMAVYTHSHSACCCEYPSCPILIERKKENKKEAGASPSAQTEGDAPAEIKFNHDGPLIRLFMENRKQ